MRRRLLAGCATAAAALFALNVPVAVSAVPSAPSNAVDTTTTLPLFGAPLTVDVTSGPGGALTSVSLNPADGYTATTVKPNKVRFVNDDGTVKVQVSSLHGGQKVEARAGELADILGPGSWSGDLFGTGTATTVDFEVAAAVDGTPDIVNVSSSDPTAVINPTKHDVDDEHQTALASIVFTSGIQSRTLWIKVSVSTDDETRAKLSVALSKLNGVALPADEMAGAHSWTGLLCDGSAATVNYTVNADGTVSDVVASPDTAQVKLGDRGVLVWFSRHERVSIRVKSRDDGETLKVSVKDKIRCDSPDPTVNTPTSIPDDDDVIEGIGDGIKGSWDGSSDGSWDDHDGSWDGSSDGSWDGSSDGSWDDHDGSWDGTSDGSGDGSWGDHDGSWDGSGDGGGDWGDGGGDHDGSSWGG